VATLNGDLAFSLITTTNFPLELHVNFGVPVDS